MRKGIDKWTLVNLYELVEILYPFFSGNGEKSPYWA